MIADFREHPKYQKGVFKTKREIEQELRNNGVDKIYYILSFGGGTQSTHLLEDHLQGKIHYDFIIMSDTGAELQFIHDQVVWWKKRQKEMKNATPFIITHHNAMEKGLEEMLFRYFNTNYQRFQLPIHCAKKNDKGELINAGIMQRQCTIDFKIVPVKQKVRQLILKENGLGPRQRIPRNIGVIIDIGFSLDEIKRIATYKSPQFKYMYLAYPLVEQNLTTDDSINFLELNNMPKKRSRCYLCPFNCDKSGMDWGEIIKEEPLSFLKACWIDEKLREVQATGAKIMTAVPFLHYSRRSLKDVYINEYTGLMTLYENDLKKWVNGWNRYINSKYMDNQTKYHEKLKSVYEQISFFDIA